MRAIVIYAAIAAMGYCVAGCSQQSQTTYGSDEKAEEAFAQGDERKPSIKTLYTLSRVFRAQNKPLEARATLVRIINENPKFLPAYQDLAELQINANELDHAVQTLQEGIKRMPQEAALHNNLGICHLMREDYDSAMESFTKASAQAPNDHRFRANLAMSLGMVGRYDESLAEYLKILPPTDAHHNVALLSQARKEVERRQQQLSAKPEPIKVETTVKAPAVADKTM